tara:strand:- start:2740 stop:3534 length:795 start_codon:yes stop_codon:yes gene_type:complete
MKEIQIRALYGSLYAGVIVGAIFLSPLAITLVILVFSSLALWEFQRLVQFKSIIPICILFLLTIYGFLGFTTRFSDGIIDLIAITINLFLIAFLFIPKKIKYNYPIKLILSVGYLVFSSYFISRSAFEETEYNAWILALLYFSIWINNTFAYLFGTILGKHKLLPSISPKKSWEGFFGGILATLLLNFFIRDYVLFFNNLNYWLIFAIIIPILATLGDFVQSYFKRIARVKDSGSLIPGHGGFYDRMDSVIFVAPFYYLLLKFV